ncbi:MAG: 50S ribosomal protein L20 [Elusimicrobiota bacterium]
MRVTRGKTKRKKHKKILKAAKGFAHAKSHRYRTAKNQVEKSLQYSTRDRKRKKREMRKLWITRVNVACKSHGLSYSRFISGLRKSDILINRKLLQEIALNDEAAFTQLVSLAQKK